ncbi:MTOR-associated protein MEAK7 [Scyliorhinus canicula]|uniref:MTOR-associated protein MEAK7 n=1 Tax=Scyliorhinus canicula TaxID=7830 RepID=UPI0018F27C8A|nr:MTOR-associated protein MEAK7 [Scyliorhinus canicula]
MGNVESHGLTKSFRSQFTSDELAILDHVFDSMAGSQPSEATKSGKAVQKQVTLAMLKAFVHDAVLGTMTVRLYNGLRSIDPVKRTDGRSDAISKKQFVVFLSHVMRGTAGEKAFVIQRMISQDADGSVKGRQIKEFTEDLISAVIHLLQDENMLRDWFMDKTSNSVCGILRLATNLMSQLKAKELFGAFNQNVVCCRNGSFFFLFRATENNIFILLLIFFPGDSKCFLFTLRPQLGIYNCTSYNDHYMYLNHGQQTMPNGLGMGGQLHYFGLWVDGDYGGGHSKAKPRCTTYNSPQLSAQEHFVIDTMELWRVGNPPEDPLSKPKSVLDSEPEAQALLHMIGKTRMSDGLRDPSEEGEE